MTHLETFTVLKDKPAVCDSFTSVTHEAGPAVRNPTFFPTSFSGCSGREKRRKKRRISDCGPRLKYVNEQSNKMLIKNKQQLRLDSIQTLLKILLI